MREASEQEIEKFKIRYCRNDETRKSIGIDFDVKIESFEELLPGKIVRSYATGNRNIENSFILFNVCDNENGIQYFPVFSESVGRRMLNAWNIPVPKKRSVFVHENNSAGAANNRTLRESRNNSENLELRNLILFTRSLMILHIDNPKPMYGALKDVYEKMELHPYWKVLGKEIKSVNTSLKNYLKESNDNKENFQNLQEYIQYLQGNIRGKGLRNTNFDKLREIMKKEYPGEEIYF